ncbi:MAG: ATP-binding protein [bacterium]
MAKYRLIGLYILLIIFVFCFALFSNSDYVLLLSGIHFKLFEHRFLELLVTIIYISIFVRGEQLFSINKDKRHLLISVAFFYVACLNIIHLFSANNFPYDILTLQNLQKNSELTYLILEKLIISTSLFLSIFYVSSSNENLKQFKSNVYLAYGSIILLFVLFHEVIMTILPEFASYRVLLFIEPLQTLNESIYFITAFIYFDMTLNKKNNYFSFFPLGIFILGIGQLFYINPHLIQMYGIIAHTLKLIGFILLFIGMKDLSFCQNSLNIKQKILASLFSFLSVLYIGFVSLSSALLNITFPIYAEYIFLEFILVGGIIQNLIADKFTEPIFDLIKGIESYVPGKEINVIEVKSNDEIGRLTAKFNEMSQLNWNYIEALIERENKITKLRDKEKILKEIVYELKLIKNLEEAYKTLINKLANIFEVDRVLFIELPVLDIYKPTIKYEYLMNNNMEPLLGKEYPDARVEDFFELLNNPLFSKMVIINNTENYKVSDKNIQDFFERYKIKSSMTSLLVRYNSNIRVLGMISICSSKSNNWTEYQIDLYKSICELMVNIIWEIRRVVELDELRNTFILTLAHDFHVPLVGEIKALEYIVSRNPDEPIGKFKTFIEEVIENNYNLTKMLKELTEIYRYESGKKDLIFEKVSIIVLINQVISALSDYARLKSISILFDSQEKLPEVSIDIKEFLIALTCVIENAINHTKKETSVTIKCFRRFNSINISITDQGSGIPEEIRDSIFMRYSMVQALSRKIGAGIQLYLTKQIIEAHHGKIWFETEMNVGTTFIISIPISDTSY